MPTWLVVFKKTVNSLICCQRAETWKVSLKSGGLALGATTPTVAAAAGERTERVVTTTYQPAAAWEARRLGRGTAALGLKRVAAVRNGGACYTGSRAPNHWAAEKWSMSRKAGAAAWGYGGASGQQRWF